MSVSNIIYLAGVATVRVMSSMRASTSRSGTPKTAIAAIGVTTRLRPL